MIALRTLPMPGSPSFSCDMEMILWLIRHADDPFVGFWWLGYENAVAGRSFERVEWKMRFGG